MTDAAILKKASEDAERILEDDPKLASILVGFNVKK